MDTVRTIEAPTGPDEYGFDWGREGDRPFVRNERQARFAWARLQGHDQTESARKAGYRGGSATLATQGSRCARSRDVQALMAAVQAARGERLDDAAEPEEVLRRISAEVRKPGIKPNELAQCTNAFMSLTREVAAQSRLEAQPSEKLLAQIDGSICDACVNRLALDLGVDMDGVRNLQSKGGGPCRPDSKANGAAQPGNGDTSGADRVEMAEV